MRWLPRAHESGECEVAQQIGDRGPSRASPEQRSQPPIWSHLGNRVPEPRAEPPPGRRSSVLPRTWLQPRLRICVNFEAEAALNTHPGGLRLELSASDRGDHFSSSELRLCQSSQGHTLSETHLHALAPARGLIGSNHLASGAGAGNFPLGSRGLAIIKPCLRGSLMKSREGWKPSTVTQSQSPSPVDTPLPPSLRLRPGCHQN